MGSVVSSAIAVSIVLPIFATCAVIARFLGRKLRKLSFLADDWVILVALITTITACVLNIYGLEEKGLGIATSPKLLIPSNLIDATKLFYSIFLLSFFTQGATKISIILFLKRMFSVNPRFQVAANIMLVATFCWTLQALIIWGMNHPHESILGPDFYHMGFNRSLAWLEAMAVLDLVFDVAVISLPLPVLGSLQMNVKRKVSVIGLFCLGFIAVIASCMRLWIIWRDVRVNAMTPLDTVTYINVENNLWLVVEACVSIIAACLPVLSGLFKGHIYSFEFTSLKSLLSRFTKDSTNRSTNVSAQGDQLAQVPGSKHDWYPLNDVVLNTHGLTATESNKPMVAVSQREKMHNDNQSA